MRPHVKPPGELTIGRPFGPRGSAPMGGFWCRGVARPLGTRGLAREVLGRAAQGYDLGREAIVSLGLGILAITVRCVNRGGGDSAWRVNSQ